MKDAWEGKVGDGRFGVDGEVTFEQNCNGKTTIRATFHDLKVARPGTLSSTPASGSDYSLTINNFSRYPNRSGLKATGD